MKIVHRQKRTLVWAVVLVPFLWAGYVTAERPYVILEDGRRMEGASIRAQRDGTIILRTERGDLTLAPEQYREAWAARPRQMDQAEQLLQRERYDDMIPVAEEIVREYRHLGWDVEAMALMGGARIGLGDYQSAISIYNRLFDTAPNRREDPAIRWAYYNALLGAERYSELQEKLDELIREGERSEAARAQVMRGDMKRQQGRVETGLLDYLRTVVLFQAQRDVQAEALFKAGLALGEMRDDRAREMFRKVVEEHGNTPYAQQARERL